MNRDDVDWQGYFPAVVTPFTETGELDLDTLEALVEHYAGRGHARHGRQRHLRRVVLAEPRRAQSRCRDCGVDGRRPDAGTGRLHRLHRGRGGRAGPARARGRRRRRAGLPAALRQAVPERDRRVLQRHQRRPRRAAGRLQLAARRRGRHRLRPRRPAGRHRHHRRRSRTARRMPTSSSRPRAGSGIGSGCSDRTCRPAASRCCAPRAATAPSAVDRSGADRIRNSGRTTGRATSTPWRRTLRSATRCSRSCGCPVAGPVIYGAYQSQLKELMRMLDQPAGHVRRPRLPVTDLGDLATMRAVLVETGLLAGADAGAESGR